jgi:hypothetical protein
VFVCLCFHLHDDYDLTLALLAAVEETGRVRNSSQLPAQCIDVATAMLVRRECDTARVAVLEACDTPLLDEQGGVEEAGGGSEGSLHCNCNAG